MSQFAAKTEVSAEKSRSEIERSLTRYGATSFLYGTQGAKAIVMFELNGRRIRFDLEFPDPNDKRFRFDGRGKQRTPEKAHAEWEQATRQRWRALALVIKAKLEAVESGITSFEEEFLAHILLPNGEKVGGWIAPQLARSYETGKMPPMLALTDGRQN